MNEILKPFFFFNDTAPTEISTLPLHDSLPTGRVCPACSLREKGRHAGLPVLVDRPSLGRLATSIVREPPDRTANGAVIDRKSTRLNSSHANISYAVFCLKKKKNQNWIADSIDA